MSTVDKPRTAAGRALLDRGSNNWTGSDWIDRFSAAIRAIEDEAALPDSRVDDPSAEELAANDLRVNLVERVGRWLHTTYSDTGRVRERAEQIIGIVRAGPDSRVDIAEERTYEDKPDKTDCPNPGCYGFVEDHHTFPDGRRGDWCRDEWHPCPLPEPAASSRVDSAEGRRLLAAATPGPWHAHWETEHGDYGTVLSEYLEGVDAPDGSWVCQFPDDYGHDSGADAALIVWLRNNAEALLAGTPEPPTALVIEEKDQPARLAAFLCRDAQDYAYDHGANPTMTGFDTPWPSCPRHQAIAANLFVRLREAPDGRIVRKPDGLSDWRDEELPGSY